MAYLSNITEAVGRTPLVKINRVVSGPATVLAKVEAFEPAGNVKDLLRSPRPGRPAAAGSRSPSRTGLLLCNEQQE